MNKLKFKFGNGAFEFEVEGDDEFVKEKTEWATTFVSQTRDTIIARPTGPVCIQDTLQTQSTNIYSSPIQFLVEKKFSTDVDITLALAYYIEAYEGKECWNTEDLRSEFSLAKRPIPTNISDAIAKNIKKCFIINPNRDDKRTYCLTYEGKEYIENFSGKDGNSSTKSKTKKTVLSKVIDPEEQGKIDEVKANISNYNQDYLNLLEVIKGQKDQTLLTAFIIRDKFGEEYEFTPRTLSAFARKMAVDLEAIQITKMISSNAKFFDNERRGWYKLNELGCKYLKASILATGE